MKSKVLCADTGKDCILVYIHRVVLPESHGDTGEHWVAQAGLSLKMLRGRRTYKGWLKTVNLQTWPSLQVY